MVRESLIKGGIPVLLSATLLICLDQVTEAPIPERLLDIVVANVTADLLIIFIAFYSGLVRSNSQLLIWYTKYGLSAVMMDTLIGIIYMVAAYEIVQVLNDKRLIYFGLLSVCIQWIGDLLFYALFSIIPHRKNAIMDLFKLYVTEAQLGALLGDTFLVIFAVLFSSLLALIRNEKYVIYILIVVLYILPYVVHTNTFDKLETTPPSTKSKPSNLKQVIKSSRHQGR
jgi:hypothetical protein